MTQHTPGPWNMQIDENSCFHQGNRVSITATSIGEEGSNTQTIAEIWPGDNDVDIVDGCLLRTAPELLAALVEAQTEITRINQAAGETIFNPAITQLISEAIEKAT